MTWKRNRLVTLHHRQEITTRLECPLMPRLSVARLDRESFLGDNAMDSMRVKLLLGVLLFVPPMLTLAQTGNAASRGTWHHSQVLNPSVCGTPRFDFWYGYYYYPNCRCWDHGWLRLCQAGANGWPHFR